MTTGATVVGTNKALRPLSPSGSSVMDGLWVVVWLMSITTFGESAVGGAPPFGSSPPVLPRTFTEIIWLSACGGSVPSGSEKASSSAAILSFSISFALAVAITLSVVGSVGANSPSTVDASVVVVFSLSFCSTFSLASFMAADGVVVVGAVVVVVLGPSGCLPINARSLSLAWIMRLRPFTRVVPCVVVVVTENCPGAGVVGVACVVENCSSAFIWSRILARAVAIRLSVVVSVEAGLPVVVILERERFVMRLKAFLVTRTFSAATSASS